MAARSVNSEHQSPVIEPRKSPQRRCLRFPLDGGRTDTPQRLGVEDRPGSENRAKMHWGSLGTCENRIRPRINADTECVGTRHLGLSVHDFPAGTMRSEPLLVGVLWLIMIQLPLEHENTLL